MLSIEGAESLFALYAASVCVFAMHVGGCCGDIYVAILLVKKYKDPKTLMRDTGPEQFFYVPCDERAESVESNDEIDGVHTL